MSTRVVLRSSSIALLAVTTLACHAPPSAPRAPSARDTPHPSSAPRPPAIVGTPIAFANESTLLALDEQGGALVSLSMFDASIRARIPVGTRPVALAALSDGRVLILDRAEGALVTLRFDVFGEHARVEARARVAPDPVAFVIDRARDRLYVASGASSLVTVLDARSLTQLHAFEVPREPSALALSADGDRLFVAHLVGGIVSVVRPSTGAVRTIALPLGPRPDSTAPIVEPSICTSSYYAGTRCTRGSTITPRLRDAATLARALVLEGDRLYVAHTVVHTGDRASYPSRYGNAGELGVPWPLDVVSVLDIKRLAWMPDLVQPARDYLAARPLAPDPSSLALHEDALLVSSLAGDAIATLDASRPYAGSRRHLRECAGASGVAVAADGTMAVRCVLSRTVHLLRDSDDRSIAMASDSSIASLGARLFQRSDAHGSRVGFFCALCHPEGRDDGLVWSTPAGPRQTPWLAGRLQDTAPFGWRGEHADLRTSLTSTRGRLAAGYTERELGAIEDHLLEGLHAPSMPVSTNERDVFARAGCADCHAPREALLGAFVPGITRDVPDGRTHDVGSGGAFDTPSLRFVGRTAPYFHDGRFLTLEDVLIGHGARVANVGALDEGERIALLRLLRQR